MRRGKKKTAVDYARIHRAREAKHRLEITPPEGVPVSFARASLGTRFGAQILDILITYVSLFLLFYLVFRYSFLSWESAMALLTLVAFLVRVPYYVLTELVWNGRTLGKRITKIRVISANGRRLEPHQVVVRNLMKEAEVFTPIMLLFGIIAGSGWIRAGMAGWLVIVFIIPIFSKQSQRLGDMIAGTVVVNQPRVAVSSELTEKAKDTEERFAFEPMHLEHYGRFELQSLEQILREDKQGRPTYERDVKVAAAIRKKIGFVEPMQYSESRAFLSAFYNAQRAHLEARQMFGDRREDKFHRSDGPNTNSKR